MTAAFGQPAYASVDAIAPRIAIRCRHCELNQYPLPSGLCRRCCQPFFAVDAPEIAPIPVPVQVQLTAPVDPRPHWTTRTLPSFWWPIALVITRHMNCLTQEQIAGRLGVKRFYVANMEGPRWIFPRTRNVDKVASAYGTTVAKLVVMIEWLMEGGGER